jgi:hypothetical protein
MIRKLRWCVIRLQRCWRGFRACTAARVRSLEIKWALVERHHRLELVDTIRLAKLSRISERKEEKKGRVADEKKRGREGRGLTQRRATFGTMEINSNEKAAASQPYKKDTTEKEKSWRARRTTTGRRKQKPGEETPPTSEMKDEAPFSKIVPCHW